MFFLHSRYATNAGKYDIENLKRYKLGYSALPAAGFNSNGNIIDDGQRLYIVSDPNLNHNNPSQFYNQGKVNIIFDRKTRDVTYSVGYPKIYKDKLNFPAQFDWRYRTYNSKNHKVVYSFPADNYIYQMNPDGSDVTAHLANSRYFSEVDAMRSISNSPEVRFEYFINNYHYTKIIYDEYRDLYYRWLAHPMNFEGDLRISGKLKAYETSVILLDNKFRKLGEVILPKKYFSDIAFVNSEGIYLYNPVDSENIISFRLVKFVRSVVETK